MAPQAMDNNIVSGCTQFSDTNTFPAAAWFMDTNMVFGSGTADCIYLISPGCNMNHKYK